jgi:hypothetical protein
MHKIEAMQEGSRWGEDIAPPTELNPHLKLPHYVTITIFERFDSRVLQRFNLLKIIYGTRFYNFESKVQGLL